MNEKPLLDFSFFQSLKKKFKLAIVTGRPRKVQLLIIPFFHWSPSKWVFGCYMLCCFCLIDIKPLAGLRRVSVAALAHAAVRLHRDHGRRAVEAVARAYTLGDAASGGQARHNVWRHQGRSTATTFARNSRHCACPGRHFIRHFSRAYRRRRAFQLQTQIALSSCHVTSALGSSSWRHELEARAAGVFARSVMPMHGLSRFVAGLRGVCSVLCGNARAADGVARSAVMPSLALLHSPVYFKVNIDIGCNDGCSSKSVTIEWNSRSAS